MLTCCQVGCLDDLSLTAISTQFRSYRTLKLELPYLEILKFNMDCWPVWLNGRAFESRPVRFQVTALGKLLTRMCLCAPSSIIWYLPMGGDALRLGR